jgi:hypothetical protein
VMLSTTRMAFAGSTAAEPPWARFNVATDMFPRFQKALFPRKPERRRFVPPLDRLPSWVPACGNYSVFRVIAAVMAAV